MTTKHSQQLTPKLEPKPSSMNKGLLISIAIIIIPIIISFFFFHSLQTSSATPPGQKSTSKLPHEYYTRFRNDNEFNRIYDVLEEIVKEEWDPTLPIQEELLSSDRPRVLTNTFISQWAAISSKDPSKKWSLSSPQWRSRLAQDISGIYVAETPYIGPLFRVNRPLLQSHENIKNYNPFSIEKHSVDEFFTKVISSSKRQSSDTSNEFFYYTGGLNTPTLSADLQPFDELLPRKEEPSINVWVGEKGVVTHAHIDSFINFFIQVEGSKRFILFAPHYSDNAYLYPLQHPSNGQAQIFPVNPPNINYQQKQFPTATYIKAYEVILHPGDLLYLPPNWFHQVHTLEPSISVTFWTQSHGQSYYNDALTIFRQHVYHQWTYPQKRFAATLVIHAILNSFDVRHGMKVLNDTFHSDIDLDPFQLKTKVKKRYGNAFEYNNNGIPIDLDFWDAFIIKNTPMGNIKTLKSLRLDNDNDYILKYFQRYVDSRYGAGFDGDIYNNNIPTYTLFPNKTNNNIEWNYYQPPINQDVLLNECQFNSNLIIDALTPEAYLSRIPAGSTQRQGPFADAKFSHYFQQKDTLTKPLPQQAYIDMLLHTSTLIAKEIGFIQDDQRPIYLTHFIESVAYWAGEPTASFLPSMMYCMKYANIQL